MTRRRGTGIDLEGVHSRSTRRPGSLSSWWTLWFKTGDGHAQASIRCCRCSGRSPPPTNCTLWAGRVAKVEDAIPAQVSWPSGQFVSPSLVIFCIFSHLFRSRRIEPVRDTFANQGESEPAPAQLAACLFFHRAHAFPCLSPGISPPTHRKAHSL